MKPRGFTIVELLIVIVVIGILAAIILVSFNGVQSKSNDAVVKSELSTIWKKIEIWKLDNDGYPDPGVPTNYLQTVGLRVSTGSYATMPTTQSNLIYCYDNTDRTKTYAIIALSKSGNAFYISPTQSGVQTFTTTWDNSYPGGDIAMCTSLDAGYTSDYRGYASNDSPVWRVWTGNS